MGNIVAIVGRPNVGKSTLFNRLTESMAAIVESESGVTRDRHYGKVIWSGREFSLIDTGGYVRGSDDVFEEQIRRQVMSAIEEANVLIFLVDVTTGITDLDLAVAEVLRRAKKKVILAANKVDTSALIAASAEFYSLGLGEVIYLSAMNGFGTGEFMDHIVSHLDDSRVEDNSELPRIAVVGKPNVGKSSLVNALLGVERNIVTDISGTTRDAIDTRYNAFGFDFILVDTAGIRKKAKVHEDIEFYSVLRAIRAIENSDVCLFMIDAQEGLQMQDLQIFYMIENNKKGVVLLVNKWDTVSSDQKDTKKIEEGLRESLAPFNDVPILFVSALTKQRIHKALETALEVHQNRIQKIPTATLNEVMLEVINNTPPPAHKGKWIKIKFVTQLPTHSPSFAFFCNLPQYVREDYKRFIENQMREKFNFTGVPLRIFFRKK